MSARGRVVAAMSGGVDSSVAAAMLKRQGYDVIGVTMQIWPDSAASRSGGCCSLSAVEDARRVANTIGISHYALNLQAEFEKLVIDDFVREYRAGRTPNPCIRCNQFVKFDVLLQRASSLGADRIATGHYARIEFDRESERWLLKRALDMSKDQSYALYTMTQEQLGRTLFPLGGQTKQETRAAAAELGLSVAEKPDSQEICFVPDNKYGGFLAAAAPDLVRPGPVLDTSGNVLGRHKGIAFYTIGQRKGLGIAASHPMYVVEIDKSSNAVVVGANSDLYGDDLVAKDVNLIGADTLSGCVVVSAKIRYNMQDSPAKACSLGGGAIRVRFETPQRAVTPGQSVVLYQDEVVVGGGIIASRNEADEILASAGRLAGLV
ncbi:MAG: tRNA 2-thiouridine(34) synthase MnmA [Armatimonadota bacterium]|nr:tRNA 2-thiouridine(34) synthase MnmA [Armatimonadota bacterium]